MSCLNCNSDRQTRMNMVYFPMDSPEVRESSVILKYPGIYGDKKYYGLQCESCGEFIIVLFDRKPNSSHFRSLFSSMSLAFKLYNKAKDFQTIARDYFDTIYDTPHLSIKDSWQLVIGHHKVNIHGQELNIPLFTDGYRLNLLRIVEDIYFYKSWEDSRPDIFIQNFKYRIEDETKHYPFDLKYLPRSIKLRF